MRLIGIPRAATGGIQPRDDRRQTVQSPKVVRPSKRRDVDGLRYGGVRKRVHRCRGGPRSRHQRDGVVRRICRQQRLPGVAQHLRREPVTKQCRAPWVDIGAGGIDELEVVAHEGSIPAFDCPHRAGMPPSAIHGGHCSDRAGPDLGRALRVRYARADPGVHGRGRPRPLAIRHLRLDRPCEDAGQAGDHPSRRGATDRRRPRTGARRLREGRNRVAPGTRGHPHPHRIGLARPDRRRCRHAPHRSLSKRPGGAPEPNACPGHVR